MREAVIHNWLAKSEWAQWNRHPITGDASSRRYERLFGPNSQSVIVMDAPPHACGSQRAFVDMANHLRRVGLIAPEILEWDETNGLMVISDLGTRDFAKHLETHPSDERRLYETSVDVLRRLNTTAPPLTGLSQMTPTVGSEMIGLAFDWAAVDDSVDLRTAISTQLKELLDLVDPSPSALSLRDFHAENLIWRDEEKQTDRVGLLDFQDAFITHSTYDLASLLRDARRDIVTEMLDDLLNRLDPDADRAAQRTAFHVMSVQRNLRILGVFRRLSIQEKKTRYLDFIPRVENHLRTDLSAPELGYLSPLISRAFFQDPAE